MGIDITCKLTGTRGPGVKAHIIPKSFYDFGEGKHQPSKLIHIAGENSRISKLQIGEYDQTIVTKEGEAFFGACDDYAHKCLVRKGQEGKLYHNGNDPLCIEIDEFDYHKLKMFFISLLWRASVSSRSLFRRVRTGPHENPLRRHILRQDPGTEQDYAVVIGIHRDTPDYGDPMIEPTLMRDEEGGFNYYKFSLGHLIACIKVDTQPYKGSWEDFVLRDGSPLRFIILDEFRGTSLYNNIKHEVRQLHNISQ